MIGNLIPQGPSTENSTLVSYMGEGSNPNNPGTDFYVVNNSFVSQYPSVTFVRVGLPPSILDQTPALLQNNFFYGPGTVTDQTNAILKTNFVGGPHFVDLNNYDYHLSPYSPAINAGSQPVRQTGMDSFSYRSMSTFTPRAVRDAILSELSILARMSSATAARCCDVGDGEAPRFQQHLKTWRVLVQPKLPLRAVSCGASSFRNIYG